MKPSPYNQGRGPGPRDAGGNNKAQPIAATSEGQRCPPPPGGAYFGPGTPTRGCRGHRATRLVPSSVRGEEGPGAGEGGGAISLPAGQSSARTGAQHMNAMAIALLSRRRAAGGDGATPFPAWPSLDRAGAPLVWVPRPSRCLAGAEQRRGGRCASPRRAEPGSGRGPTCVGATAVALCSFDAEQQRGASNAAPYRAEPGSGRGPT